MNTSAPLPSDGSSLRRSRSAWRTFGRRALAFTAGALVAGTVTVLLAATAGLPFTEDFTNQNLDDIAQTTADWGETQPGTLTLPTTQQNIAPAIQSLTSPFGPSSNYVTLGSAAADQSSVRAMALVDVDGDGLLDVVAGGPGKDRLYLNSGDGADPYPTGIDISPTTENTRAVVTGDFDNDGYMDIVIGNASQDMSRIIYGNGPGQPFDERQLMPTPVAPATPDPIQSLAAADVDGDGDIDILAGTGGNSSDIYFENTGAGDRGPSGFIEHVLPVPPSGDDHTGAVALGDMDRDGLMDAVIVTGPVDQSTPGYTWLYLNDGSGNPFDTITPTKISNDTNALDPTAGSAVALGDLDGDGYLDVVIGNAGIKNDNGTPLDESDDYIELDANGDRTDLNRVCYSAPPVPPARDPFAGLSKCAFLSNHTQNTTSVAIADMDNDGNLDIVVGNLYGLTGPRSGENRLYLNDGNDPPDFSNNTKISTDGANPPSAPDPVSTRWVLLGDVNGDGRPDVIAGTDNGEYDALYLNTGNKSGSLAAQLTGFAASGDVAQGAVPQHIRFGIDAANAGVDSLNGIDFWFSNSDPNTPPMTWRKVTLGRYMNLGTSPNPNLYWRAELHSSSPVTAPNLAVNKVMIKTSANDPVLSSSIGDQTATQDALFTLNVASHFNDADTDPLTYSATGLPTSGNLTLDANQGILQGTPTNDDVLGSPYTVTVTADDGHGGQASDTFTLTVNNVNDAPTFTSTPVDTATVGQAYSYDVTASDADPTADTLTITATTKPSWLTLTDNGDGTATLAGTPSAADAGSPAVTLTVSDGTASTDQDFTITVASTNSAPSITSTAVTSATVGRAYTYNIAATDSDAGDTLTITATSMLPSWLTLTDNGDGTARLSGTPTATGSQSVALRVTDASNATGDQSFTITVSAAPSSSGGSSGGGGSMGFPEVAALLLLVLAERLRRRPLRGAARRGQD